MTKKYNLKDIRFVTDAEFGPSGLLLHHSKLVSIASKLTLNGIECFTIISDWFQHYPTNTSDSGQDDDLIFKNSMMKDLKEKVDFEILFYQLEPGLSAKKDHSSVEEINQLSLLLWQMIKSDLETYKMYRSFFLEKITYHYILKKYRVPKKKVFHEPKILVKRYPVIEKFTREFSIGNYSPKNIKVDFMFKMAHLVRGIFAFECKVDMVSFNKSLKYRKGRGLESRKKLYYLECIKSFILNKLEDSGNGFYVAFTTFGDYPENYVFQGTNFSVDAHIIKAADMSKIFFSTV